MCLRKSVTISKLSGNPTRPELSHGERRFLEQCEVIEMEEFKVEPLSAVKDEVLDLISSWIKVDESMYGFGQFNHLR